MVPRLGSFAKGFKYGGSELISAGDVTPCEKKLGKSFVENSRLGAVLSTSEVENVRRKRSVKIFPKSSLAEKKKLYIHIGFTLFSPLQTAPAFKRWNRVPVPNWHADRLPSSSNESSHLTNIISRHAGGAEPGEGRKFEVECAKEAGGGSSSGRRGIGFRVKMLEVFDGVVVGAGE